jgi:hypothetical protein
MSPLLNLNEENLAAELFPIINEFEADIEKSAPLFDIEGARLEAIARDVPQHQAFYDMRAREAKQLVKMLEGLRDKIEARLTKNHLQGQRVYGARETTVLIAGTREMVEHNQLIIEVSLIQQKLEAIVDSFKQMGWMVGHIAKLRVAELQDVIL